MVEGGARGRASLDSDVFKQRREEAIRVFGEKKERLDAEESFEIPPSSYGNEENPILRTAMMDLVVVHFDKILNAERIIRRGLVDGDSRVRGRSVDALMFHFDEILEADALLRSSFGECPVARRKTMSGLRINPHLIEGREDLLEDGLKDFVNEEVRVSALRVFKNNFGKIKGAEGMFLPLIEDEKARVRAEALEVVFCNLDEIADPWGQIAKLESDPSSEVLWAVGGSISSLPFWRGFGSKERLERFLSSGSKEIRVCLMGLLKVEFDRIPGAEDYIKTGIQDSDPTVRRWALWALLKRFPKFRKIPLSLISESLEDDDPQVRSFAFMVYREVVDWFELCKNFENGEENSKIGS